jgi:hypothetical protein
MAEGPELLTNGDFATDFSSWTDTSPGSGGFARRYAPSANMEVASGFIFVPPIGPQPATATGSQSFTVTVSTTYVVRFDVDTAASAPVSKGGVSTRPWFRYNPLCEAYDDRNQLTDYSY